MGIELKHTEIGDIPVDWEVQTFEETFRVLSNNTLSRAELNNRGGTVRNIHYGDILVQYSEVLDCANEDIPYITDTYMLGSSAMLLQDGDIVIADTAEDETVGKVTEISGLGHGKLVAGLHTIPCRVKKGDFAPGWLGYYMNSYAYHNQILPFITGIKVSSISKSAIANTLILVPPKNVQAEIVEVLNDLEKTVQSKRKILSKIERLKIACLQAMFPAASEEKPNIRMPSYSCAWDKVKISEMGNIVTGSTPSTKDRKNYGGEYLFVSPVDIQNNRYVENTETTLSEVGFMQGRVLSPDSVLFVSIGSTIGKVAQVKRQVVTNQQINSIEPYEAFDSNFIYSLLQKESNNIRSMASTQAVPILKKSLFSDIELLITKDKTEQVKIGDYFLLIDNLLMLQYRNILKYQGIKESLITELITGKTRLV